MYMPKVYIDCNATEEKYSLNAFGVFKEMEALKEMSYDLKRNTLMHRLAFQKDYSLIDNERRYCPFYYLIPVDVQTDKGTSLGDTQTMYRNTAEMLYHVHNSAAGAAFRNLKSRCASICMRACVATCCATGFSMKIILSRRNRLPGWPTRYLNSSATAADRSAPG